MTGIRKHILRVRGTDLVAGDEVVVLRGVGLGGWLNMENFITGYSGSESQHRRALRRAMGVDAYEAFFASFLDTFFTDDDARLLADAGLNSVRVPFNYRHFESDERPFELLEAGFERLDRLIEACGAHGLYVVLDLHAVPGRQNQHWHSDNPTQWADFWNQRQFQDRVVHLWEALASRYRGNPVVAGYNPVNEPADASGEVIGPFYRRLAAAIRAVDPDHVLFLDGNRYSTQFDQLGEPLPNSVYTAHDYAVPGFLDGGPYPGPSRGEHYDRERLEQVFLARTRYMRDTGTPIWIGEFGPMYTGDPAVDESRYRVLQDQLDIYRDHGASWALWTYKDIGLQGLVHVREGDPYLERLAPALEKKRRLGVDAWGSTDAGVREVLAPLVRLVADEFPDFDPYPWGQERWIHGHVRHILLAEAMVDDVARRFAGVTTEEATELGAAFALARCARRDRLIATLRSAAAQETTRTE